ncbi:integrase core domain-containing protein [Pedobacter sp. R20-19]
MREAVELYNTKRPHLSLGYKTPDQIYKKSLPILYDKDYIYS